MEKLIIGLAISLLVLSLALIAKAYNQPLLADRPDDTGAATVVIAAYNSGKQAQADYVCPDGNAQDIIVLALNRAEELQGNIYFQEGYYKCSAPITGSWKHLNIRGAGPYATQIVQLTPDANLFELSNIGTGWHISDLSLGVVDGSGTVFELTKCHRGTMEDVWIIGWGKYGVHLKGCLLNTFKNVEITVNGPALCEGVRNSGVAGFKLETYGGVACNANTFIGCVIEGGQYGWDIRSNAQGTNTILGGCAEGNDMQYGLYAEGNLSLQLFGTHFECLGIDIKLISCAASNIVPTKARLVELVSCQNVSLEGMLGEVIIDAASINCTVKNAYAEAITNYSASSEIWHTMHGGDNTWGGLGIHNRNHSICDNRLFEVWQDGLPIGFGNSGFYPGAIIEQSEDARVGNYSAKITKTQPMCIQGMEFYLTSEYQGQWLSIEFWAKSTGGQPGLFWRFNGSVKTLWLPPVADEWVKVSACVYGESFTGGWLVFSPDYIGDSESLYISGINIWAEY